MKHTMARMRIALILFSLTGLLSSCFAPASLPIQVLRPAQFNFPDSLFTAGILNASLVESDFFSEEDSLWYTDKQIFLHNIAATEFSLTLAEVLMFSPRFSSTPGIQVRELDPYEYLDTIPPPFTPVELEAIAGDFEKDLILAAEFFHLEQIPVPQGFTVNLNRPSYKVLSMYSDGVPKDMKLVRAKILIRMYDAETGFALREYELADSVLWLTSLSYSRKDAEFSEEDYFFYENTGRHLGELLAKKLAPWWEEEEREYYWGTQVDFSQAYFYALDNKWNLVENTMKRMTAHKSKRKAGYAWYNLAVSLEMQGKIAEAHEAMENAVRLKPPAGIARYRSILNKRLQDKELLDRQLGK